jgi:hypothetical protein
MKVKDLIAELSKLDQEKGIWCIYDGFALISLVPEEEVDEYDVSNFKNKGMELGDYVINAG